MYISSLSDPVFKTRRNENQLNRVSWEKYKSWRWKLLFQNEKIFFSKFLNSQKTNIFKVVEFLVPSRNYRIFFKFDQSVIETNCSDGIKYVKNQNLKIVFQEAYRTTKTYLFKILRSKTGVKKNSVNWNQIEFVWIIFEYKVVVRLAGSPIWEISFLPINACNWQLQLTS